MIDALRDVLPQLPETFDKFDVLPLLGFEPRRSTFYEALNRLTLENQVDLLGVWKELFRVRKELHGVRSVLVGRRTALSGL